MQSDRTNTIKNKLIVAVGYILWFLGFFWMLSTIVGFLGDLSKNREINLRTISIDAFVAIVGYIFFRIGKKLAIKK
jgi:tellurite resistance protein TehA-like permease